MRTPRRSEELQKTWKPFIDLMNEVQSNMGRVKQAMDNSQAEWLAGYKGTSDFGNTQTKKEEKHEK